MAKNGTEAAVAKLPNCDIHKYTFGEIVTAQYDGKTTQDSPGQGSWAYMCEDCFDNYGKGLGLGVGQRLVVQS